MAAKMDPDASAILSSIAATAATSHVKKYLMYFGSGKLSPDVIANALEKVKPKPSSGTSDESHDHGHENDSALIHLQIYLFVNDPAVQDLVVRFRKQLMPLTPMNPAGGGITKEFYVQILFQLNLHKEFLQMIMATSDQTISMQLTSAVVESLMKDFGDNKIEPETMKLYLVVLALLGVQSEEYKPLFKNLMAAWMNSSSASVTKFHKVQVLLRIIGLTHLTKEELKNGDSEICELMQKTEFNPTQKMRNSKTFQMYKVFYPPTASANEGEINGINGHDKDDNGSFHPELQSSDSFMDLLKEFCTEEILKLSDEEKADLSNENSMSLLGNYAHIAQLILETQHKPQDVLMKLARFWAQFKPKSTFEDFEGSIRSFEDICQLVSLHATNKSRHQKRWFEEFLKYSESCETPAGFRILEGVIAENCDLELSLNLIAKLKEAAGAVDEDEGTSQRIKSIIMTVARQAFERGWKDELVVGVYGSSAHDEFTTFGFASELQGLLTKAGALEFDPKAKFLGGAQISTLAKERSEYCSAIFRLFFENPIECTLKMVPLSIRSQKFQVLHFVQPFLALKTEHPVELVGFPSTPNLLEYCLLTILLNAHEKDSLFEAYEKNVCLLVKENLLTFQQLYEIIFFGLERVLFQEDFGKWLKILRVWANLFEYVVENKATLDEEATERFVEDILRMVLWTWLGVSARNHQPMLEGREQCLELLEVAKKHGLYKDKCKDDIRDFDSASMTLRELGLLWAKSPTSWSLVTKHLLANRQLIDSLTEDKLISYMIPWVTNACRLEWNSVLDFAENLIRLKGGSGDDGPINIHSVANYALVMSEMQPQIRVSHYLAFYSHFLRRQQTLKGYRVMYKEHRNTVATLVLFIQKTHDPMKGAESGKKRFHRDEYRSGLVQQSLLLLHEYIEWLILKSTHEHFGQIQEACLELIPGTLFSIREEGCFSSMSIYEAIILKLTKGKEGCDETVFERNVSVMKMGVGGSRVQITVPAKSGLKAEILENYASYYENDTNGDADAHGDGVQGHGLEDEGPAEDDTKDMYPFHNTATEISAKLAVELKFSGGDE